MSFINLTERVRDYMRQYHLSGRCALRASGAASSSWPERAPAVRDAELFYLVPRGHRPLGAHDYLWVAPGDSVVLRRVVARFYFARVDGERYQMSVDALARDWRYAGPVSFGREPRLVAGGGPVFRVAALQLAYDGRPMRALLEVTK